jgi:hypothetical protein
MQKAKFPLNQTPTFGKHYITKYFIILLAAQLNGHLSEET